MGSVGACGTAINFIPVGPWRILFLCIAFERHASAAFRSYRTFVATASLEHFPNTPISPISKPLPTVETNCIMQNYSKEHSKSIM